MKGGRDGWVRCDGSDVNFRKRKELFVVQEAGVGSGDLSGGRSAEKPAKMGIHFGNLERVRHVITYSLSPFEQRAFPNYFSNGIPNLWRRFRTQVFRVTPPFFIGYMIYSWGNEEFERLKRKNPADYVNDK
ncbi:cytochrome b-c1 complex subunit 8 [Paroedura picta]|uniref:cytochrome b-c1 complex subunit 8 n=1 Tax=Paroedura picta TaxID=143630 RepID=UPI00101515CE